MRSLLVVLALVLVTPAHAVDLLAGGKATFTNRTGTRSDSASITFKKETAFAGTLPSPVASTAVLRVTTEGLHVGPLILDPSLWSERKPGRHYTYRDKDGTNGGLIKMDVSTDGTKGKLTVKLKGDAYGALGTPGPSSFAEVELSIGDTTYCGRFAVPPSKQSKNDDERLIFTGATSACLVARSASTLASCDGSVRVDPIADADAMTAAVQNALNGAAPLPGLVGPDGHTSQSRVYLPAGVFKLKRLDMPSNVRLEIDPGATIVAAETQPVVGCDGASGAARAIFNFGRVIGGTSTPARNVTIVAGDGCGGPGTPTRANKPTSTGFRGNDPMELANGVAGMANIDDLFADPYWPLDTMWVLDVDARAWGGSQENFGFFVQNAYDVVIERVFSIQNAERKIDQTDCNDTVRMSRTAVMVLKPPTTAVYSPVTEDIAAPHRIASRWHFNILSPSGYGPDQVQACFDCRFENVFSHGGTALRLETDVPPPLAGNDDCTGTGPNGMGFPYFAKVDGLTAHRVAGAFGNSVAMLSPHCRPNGRVAIRDVRGTNMRVVATVENGEVGQTINGYFDPASVLENVQGAPGENAQDPRPAFDTYRLAPSAAAFRHNSEYTVQVRGTVCWPSDGPPLWSTIPLPGDFVLQEPPCPSWPAP